MLLAACESGGGKTSETHRIRAHMSGVYVRWCVLVCMRWHVYVCGDAMRETLVAARILAYMYDVRVGERERERGRLHT